MPPRQPGADGTAGTGPWTASSDVCQPEAAFGAYKAAYKLADSPEAVCGADAAPEVTAVAQCVAASRNDVYKWYDVAAADSDLSGWKCGTEYGQMPTWPCDFDDAALYVSVLRALARLDMRERPGPRCLTAPF